MVGVVAYDRLRVWNLNVASNAECVALRAMDKMAGTVKRHRDATKVVII